MGELYEPYPKLPKNIRQIGERDDIVRVYVEDYVNTYLKRLFPKGGQDLRAGLLLGNVEEHGGIPYVFIDGALEMEGVTQEGEKVAFSEEAWKQAYQAMEEMFPKRTVQGWFLCGLPGSQLSPLDYWKQHGQYFAGKNKVMYLNCGLEGEEALYITSSDGFYKLRGHCIYYERNQMMQDYMVMRKDSRQVEAGGSDTVIRDFRRKMEKRKEQADSQNFTVRFLKGVCACLAILALAGGVAAFNSAEKLKNMEAVVASALPDADAVAGAGKQYLAGLGAGLEKETKGGASRQEGMVIEEAPGEIFPAVSENPSVGQAGGDEGAPGEQGGPAEGAEADRDQETEPEAREGISSEVSPDNAGSGSTRPADEEISQAETGEGSRPAESISPGSPEEGAQEADEALNAVPAAAPALERQLEPKPGQSVYVVQEGETLYGICFQFYQNLSKVDEICRVNGLEDINMLEAGRRLIMP